MGRLWIRVFVLLGALLVVPWLLFSIQGVLDDAPDMPREWAWLMLAAQVLVVAVFLANWWRWRAGPAVLGMALVGYAGACAGAAASNGGAPVLAVLGLVGPSLLAAVPLLLTGRFRVVTS